MRHSLFLLYCLAIVLTHFQDWSFFADYCVSLLFCLKSRCVFCVHCFLDFPIYISSFIYIYICWNDECSNICVSILHSLRNCTNELISRTAFHDLIYLKFKDNNNYWTLSLSLLKYSPFVVMPSNHFKSISILITFNFVINKTAYFNLKECNLNIFQHRIIWIVSSLSSSHRIYLLNRNYIISKWI